MNNAIREMFNQILYNDVDGTVGINIMLLKKCAAETVELLFKMVHK